MGAGVVRAFMTVGRIVVTTACPGRAHALVVAQRGVEDRRLVLLLRDRGVVSALSGHLSWVEYERYWDDGRRTKDPPASLVPCRRERAA